jgi:hypothetical protein
LSINECLKVAEEKLLMPPNDCEAALRYLGKLNIIFFHPILPNLVFCNAQIILDKITELVRCSHALRTEGEVDEEKAPLCMQGFEFRDLAWVDPQCLEKAFPSHYRDGLFTATDLLKLLEGLFIAGKLKNGKHFVPSLLPDLALNEIEKYRVTSPNPKHPAPMAIHYPKMWLPVGVMPALVACLQTDFQWEPSEKFGTPTCMYHNCVQFKLPGGKPGSVALIDSTKFLEIHVKARRNVDTKLCFRIRENVMSGLKAAHTSLHYGPPKTREGFLCSGECGNEETHLATLDDDRTMWTCSEDESIGDDLDEMQKLWLAPLKHDSHKVTVTLNQLQVLYYGGGKEIRVMDRVTGGWDKLAIALGLEDTLEIIKKDCFGDSSGACLKLFMQWMKGKGRMPVSWEVLLRALRDARYEEVAAELELALWEPQQ